MRDLNDLKKSAEEAVEKAKNAKSLERIKILYLGRKGELTRILRSLKYLPLEERRQIGFQAQRLKKDLERLFEIKLKNFQSSVSNPQPRIDITRPGAKIKLGHLHPLSKIEEEIRGIFSALNFSVVEGPEIENEYYNFDALNVPADHPARDGWDTFWIKSEKRKAKSEKLLLRTHTSPMQIRYMETHQPPFQIIVPGRVFRYEATDATHETTFSQMEGLMAGRDVSLANFKYIIEIFLKKLFGPKTEFKLMPSYYPFVEPGVDVYLKWQGKWLEVAGAGLIHPRVLKAVKINPQEWQGFAFGFGLNRLAMIKYKIPDVRLFYSGDLRFIEQF